MKSLKTVCMNHLILSVNHISSNSLSDLRTSFLAILKFIFPFWLFVPKFMFVSRINCVSPCFHLNPAYSPENNAIHQRNVKDYLLQFDYNRGSHFNNPFIRENPQESVSIDLREIRTLFLISVRFLI